MGWDRLDTSEVVSLTEQVKYAAKDLTWTGYDDNPAEILSKKITRLTEDYNKLVIHHNEKKAENVMRIWRPVVISTLIIGLVLGFIYFVVHANTYWGDAKKAVRSEIVEEVKGQLPAPEEYLIQKGFDKTVIKDRVGGQDRLLIIWHKIE
jgi:hypothetical protein